MKKIINIMFLLSSILFIGCDRDVNKWDIEPEYDGLFRPLTFEEGKVNSTAIEIAYTKVLNADYYVFEFSKDSLQFEEIIRRDTILSDTLTAYSENSSQMKTTYHTWFNKLEGSTKYSVRMKGRSELTQRESGYSSFFFETPGEQLFTNVTVKLEEVIFDWTPGEEVNKITIYERNEVGELSNPTDYALDAAATTAGTYTVTNLKMGTSYTAKIFLGERVRGTVNFRTSGMLNSIVINVAHGIDIQAILSEKIAEGKNSFSLLFEGTSPYEIEGLALPDGIENLTFVGIAANNAGDTALPHLQLGQITLSSSINSLAFENLSIDGNGTAYLLNIGDANCFSSLSLSGCNVTNYGNSILRMKTNGLSVESISIDNCIISKVSQSGYAVICDEKEQEKVGEISITNTTLKEIGMLLRTNKGVQSVVIDRCTFYNHTFGTGNMFRLDAQPTEMTVTNLILAGDNAGMEFGCYKNYDYLDFSTCYITNELAQAKYGFTNVITFAGTAEDLFVAPENGDFHIKPNVNFGGKGKAGDPRWEEE